MSMKLTFWGAAQQVTGSMHLLTLDSGYQILVDCGLDYDQRDQFEANNKHFPFLPEDIDLVILTHAHIDHSGNLPNLVRQGFKGQILCSHPSIELTKNLLLDSLNVQQIEGKKKLRNKKHQHKQRLSKAEQVATLYNRVHIDLTVEAMKGLDFYRPYDINDDVQIELFEAGHILGAASVKMSIKDKCKVVRIGFTGDLGNYHSQLVIDPQPMGELDYMVSESTYGGRLHTDHQDAKELLLQYVLNTCVKYKGKLVIPAFSVGRTQSILYTFNQLYAEGLLQGVRVYTDSPLAIKTTRLYAEHVNQLNQEAQAFYKAHGTLFAFPDLYTLERSEDSKMLATMPEPAVIVSAAGMVEGGRIQEHIRHHIGDTFSTILIAGYCAEGTLGAELLKGRPSVTIGKRPKQVYAKIARTDVFSAHPDQAGLLKYYEACHYKQLKKLFLVHGDLNAMATLKSKLEGLEVETPFQGQSFDLH